MEQENAGLSTVNIHSDPVDIEFINVTKLYDDVVALDNTNLKIPRGFSIRCWVRPAAERRPRYV